MDTSLDGDLGSFVRGLASKSLSRELLLHQWGWIVGVMGSPAEIKGHTVLGSNALFRSFEGAMDQGRWLGTCKGPQRRLGE